MNPPRNDIAIPSSLGFPDNQVVSFRFMDDSQGDCTLYDPADIPVYTISTNGGIFKFRNNLTEVEFAYVHPIEGRHLVHFPNIFTLLLHHWLVADPYGYGCNVGLLRCRWSPGVICKSMCILHEPEKAHRPMALVNREKSILRVYAYQVTTTDCDYSTLVDHCVVRAYLFLRGIA